MKSENDTFPISTHPPPGYGQKEPGQKEPASKLLGQKVPGQKELHHRTKNTSYLYLKQIVTFISITHVNFICISFNTFLTFLHIH